MALIAVAADKGAPGVTTTAIALAAVWPRPVLLAECDPGGGDVACWLPADAAGGRLDPQRGLLSMAVAARRGVRPEQVWAHAQKLRGGLDVLLGTANAEQGAGLDPLWGTIGTVLGGLPAADVIADCGRIGPDGPFYDLLAHAAAVVLVARPSLGEVLRLRDRAAAVAQAARRRTGRPGRVGVLLIADHRALREAVTEVGQAVAPEGSLVSMLGGVAFEPRSAEALRGEWGGKLDRSLFIRTAREVAGQLAGPWWLPGRAAGEEPAPAAGRVTAGPLPGRPEQAVPRRAGSARRGGAPPGWARAAGAASGAPSGLAGVPPVSPGVPPVSPGVPPVSPGAPSGPARTRSAPPWDGYPDAGVATRTHVPPGGW